MGWVCACCLGAGALLMPIPSMAVLFYSTGTVSHNTNAPTGSLQDSGWQYQGRFRNATNHKYLGTPISWHYFITARHISDVAVGEPFYFGGTTYTTTFKTNLTNCDLTLWKVDQAFPYYAPIYAQTINSNDPLIVFGRGTRRGAAVYVNGAIKGWRWGAKDYVMRWGQNLVESMTTVSGPYGANEPVIKADFDENGVTNECMLSVKDSGGAVFIEDSVDGRWKLAGINSYVSPSTFSTNLSYSPVFSAAVFDYSFKVSDAEKLYTGVGIYAQEGLYPASQPVSFYSSHVAAHLAEIQTILGDEYDADGDGMPDWWEVLHGGDATSMVATNSNDSDEFTNFQEWIADTDPTDGDSYFKMGLYTNVTSLSFTSSTNREYEIEYRLNLADSNETWMTEVSWFQPLSTQAVKTVAAPTSNRFFRVQARLP